MRCPFCAADDTQVKDSRPTDDKMSIRRRRICNECGGRFTTFERIQLRELFVIKKEGRVEPFDREKIARSIKVASNKRNITAEQIEVVVNKIVMDLESRGENEIKSDLIGEKIMDALAELDQVAYVRYASVYRNFLEAKDFEKFIGDLDSVSN